MDPVSEPPRRLDPTGPGLAKAWMTGQMASHPEAARFASEVAGLVHRYATEVVAAHGLCPFLHQVESGLGAVAIVLSREVDVAEATRAIRATGESVVHVVFPLVPRDGASKFERFANSVAEALRRDGGPTLVHATFHPELTGGTENPHRLVGLLRRSPDPFIQFIPPGMNSGGTVIAGAEVPTKSPIESTFERAVAGGALTDIEAKLVELVAVRAHRVDPFVVSAEI